MSETGDCITVDFPDFIDQTENAIRLRGKLEHIENLYSYICRGFCEQDTPSKNFHCGLYALEISLASAIYDAGRPDPLPSFQELLDLKYSPQFLDAVSNWLDRFGWLDEETWRELAGAVTAEDNFDFNTLRIVLSLLDSPEGTVWQLGTVNRNWTREYQPSYDIVIYNPISGVTPTGTIWLTNDNAMAGPGSWDAFNHWSAVGLDETVVAQWPVAVTGETGTFDPSATIGSNYHRLTCGPFTAVICIPRLTTAQPVAALSARTISDGKPSTVPFTFTTHQAASSGSESRHHDPTPRARSLERAPLASPSRGVGVDGSLLPEEEWGVYGPAIPRAARWIDREVVLWIVDAAIG
ncbi:hypothetical protein M501DRAFT_1054240 [Patellaria atrata CBS 101060]|uniref:Uncharacterized protein n=1 Tax=Patellaria atrata CBS 101060 TaxID=1346257 RepID=A0A9P4SIC8_9PEZI|nr:hypothetical protein M501DRAFT_1054240 [Patellaria atrata CBS 101060]